MKNFFVFDIETIPTSEDVSSYVDLKQYEHTIICASGILCTDKEILPVIFSEPEISEKEIVTKLFNIFESNPTLISWNGRIFDIPILQFKGLKYLIKSKNYWDQTSSDKKWNNYQSRYHNAHVDLCDLLSNKGAIPFSKLNDISKFLGLPGKMDCSVLDCWKNKEYSKISTYCLIDVLNTLFIYLRYLIISEVITTRDYNVYVQKLRVQVKEINEILFNFMSNICFLKN